ncbi:MAG: RagB/SusD family nutrient uptake outer membrane protein [Muribaculum sp.]|nr:RagB/SusD family nutrient uptake outer membrane protein [Muribaculum sp.]
MKLKSIILGSAVLATMGLTACVDSFLDTMPDNRVELTSVESLRLLMNTAYPNYNYAVVCELSSDNVVDNNSPDKDGMRYNLAPYDRGDDELYAWEDVKSSTDDDSPSGTWEAYYASIAACNAVLEKIAEFEALTDAEKENVANYDMLTPLKGEALVLRAYDHFILANIFCEAYRGPELSKSLLGIPYMTKPETTVKPHYERGNLADVYDKIEADLNAGLPLINNGIYEIPKYHFNAQAANAFAARFYLFKRDYQKAYDYANMALGGDGVDASQYMNTIWQNLDQFYYISDFGKFANNIDKPRNFMLIATYSVAMRRYYGSRRYACNREAKRATVQGPGPTWENYKYISSSGKGETFSMNPCFNGACGTNGKSEYGTYFAGTTAEQFEITNKIAQTGYAHITRSEFNGEETLLTRAEARLFLGDTQGCLDDLVIWEESHHGSPSHLSGRDYYTALTIASINDFYESDARASGSDDYLFGIVKPIHLDEVCPSADYSVTSDIEPMLQCIQHFRRIETIHTGMRWFDIKRFGLEITHKIGKDRVETLTMMDPRKAIQIPTEVLSAGLEPNARVQDSGLSDIEYCVPVN